jgi:hypothetical protein
MNSYILTSGIFFPSLLTIMEKTLFFSNKQSFYICSRFSSKEELLIHLAINPLLCLFFLHSLIAKAHETEPSFCNDTDNEFTQGQAIIACPSLSFVLKRQLYRSMLLGTAISCLNDLHSLFWVLP